MIYIIGCGGVGSWLAPNLAMLTRDITLVDGDILEEKNLNRQLFSRDDIGRNKAEVLAARHELLHLPKFYSYLSIDHADIDWIFCVVDNHAARKDVLNACDAFGCQAILGANETYSSEAYYYHREFKYSPVDPRVYYPEILTDESNNPLSRGTGCTGKAQEENPQLASANYMAGALCVSLYTVWNLFPSMDQSIKPKLPYRFRSNLSRLETNKIEDVCPEIHQNHQSHHRESILNGRPDKNQPCQ